MAARLRDKVEAEAARLLRERSLRLQQTIERALEALGEPVEIPLSPGDWGTGEGHGRLQSLRDATETISRHQNQRDILTALIDGAAAFWPRVVLFVYRESKLHGWAGLGFLGEGGFTSHSVSRVTLPATGGHLLARALGMRLLQQAGVEGPGDALAQALGGVRVSAACAAPILVRDRPAGVLYGDSGAAGGGGDPLAFEILVRFASLAIERLGPPARAGAATGPHDLRPELRSAAPSGGRPAQPTPPEESEVQALLADLDASPRRDGGDGGLSDEERRRHADARRFARLLVSEILLYNEEAVVQGRRHRDLGRRLEKEIDRSRKAYESRFPRSTYGTDYFGEEIVRTIAQGDRSLLGGAPSSTARASSGR